VIVPEKDSSGLEFIQGDFSGFTREAVLPMPFYNICLASNASLPTLPISIFGASLEWSYSMQNKHERIALLEQRLKNLATTIQNLESSNSFRIGRALTAPLRWFSGRNQSK
jgi:hypothetical protein